MTQDIYAAAIADAALETDMNTAQAGGGGYVPPAAGQARARFIGYIEIGQHVKEYQGQTKTENQAILTFEISGPKHPVNDKGELARMSITLNRSLNEKANFYKLFKRMNYDGTARIFAQMLGRDFLCTITHNPSADGKVVFASLKDDGGYTIRAPFVEDPDTGESRKVSAAPQVTPTKCFLWDYATLDMWKSIFIDGIYEARTAADGTVLQPAKSKNVYQDQIRAAVNFAGSPIANLLDAGDEVNLPDAEKPVRTAANDDPLMNAA